MFSFVYSLHVLWFLTKFNWYRFRWWRSSMQILWMSYHSAMQTAWICVPFAYPHSCTEFLELCHCWRQSRGRERFWRRSIGFATRIFEIGKFGQEAIDFWYWIHIQLETFHQTSFRLGTSLFAPRWNTTTLMKSINFEEKKYFNNNNKNNIKPINFLVATDPCTLIWKRPTWCLLRDISVSSVVSRIS